MIDWLRKDMFDPEVELDGRKLPITLRRHPRAKRLTLRLAPDGSEVRITLPTWARSKEAIAFAHARRDWLAVQLAKLPPRNAPMPGGSFDYRGEKLIIDWCPDAPRQPKLDGRAISLGGPLGSLEGRLRRWLERQAIGLLTQDVKYYCEQAGLEPAPLSLSRAQKRWGSCSDRKKIRINWRLIQAPDFVRRSVVAHEVTHLVHFDHSPAFHTMLERLFEDDVITADSWLKEHGRSLYTCFG